MVDKLFVILRTETGKDTAVVFLTTAINLLLAGFFFILAPRILGPADFGIFATVVATGILATNIANFGIDSGILRFASDGAKRNQVLSLAFKTYLILGIAASASGFLISPFLAKLLGQAQITPILRIAFGSTVILLLTNFYVASLQAKKEFLKASLVNISSNFVKLIILGIAAYLSLTELNFVTIIFFFTPIVSVVVGRIFSPFNFEKSTKAESVNFFRYNLWIALSLIVASIPFDNYFLLKLAGPVQTGLYAAPFKLLTFVNHLAGNFIRVLAPRFASFETNAKAKVFAIKSLGIAFLVSILLASTILLPNSVFSIILGEGFSGSGNIFRILAVGFIFFFVGTVPTAIILYFSGKSQLTFIVTVIKLLIFISLLYFYVPSLKAIGAATAFAISEAVSLTLLSLLALYRLK